MSGEGGGCSEGETSEQDESSSSHNNKAGGMEDLLESFRQEWQRELEEPTPIKHHDDNVGIENKTSSQQHQQSEEEAKARSLFLEGVALEGEGKLHDAIRFYRRAVQLVPDIEFKVYATSEASRHHTPQHKKQGAESQELSPVDDVDMEDLTSKFQNLLAMQGSICQRDINTKMTHMCQLPPELLILLLRWIVSADLDLRSLESCSEVCRGFYLAARDNEIWKLVCARIWGPASVSVGDICWRDNFLSKPRVHFHGCYISRTTYIRPGEHSFQDTFYHLWHSVHYYRYIRFFPGGLVYMLTSAEEPAVAVTCLRSRTPRNPAILCGRYKLCDDTVTMELRPAISPTSSTQTSNNNRYRGRRRNQEIQHDSGEKTFHVVLQIAPYRNKNNFQLSWQSYCVETKYRTAEVSMCPFELTSSKFPPLWFSRVKSYTAFSDECL